MTSLTHQAFDLPDHLAAKAPGALYVDSGGRFPLAFRMPRVDCHAGGVDELEALIAVLDGLRAGLRRRPSYQLAWAGAAGSGWAASWMT